MKLRLKRVYEEREDQDGIRILVDRLWPRGLRRDDARIGHWIPDVAPSTELRRWFGHEPPKWNEFKDRYMAELAENFAGTDQIRAAAHDGTTVTLVFAARNERHNHAVVLKEFLECHPSRE